MYMRDEMISAYLYETIKGGCLSKITREIKRWRCELINNFFYTLLPCFTHLGVQLFNKVFYNKTNCVH